MAYAIRHTDRLRRLVLVGAMPPRMQDCGVRYAEFFPDTWERYQALWLSAQLGDGVANQERIELHFFMMCCSPGHREAWLTAISPVSVREHLLQGLLSDAEQYDLTPALPQLSHPTMVITGRFDIVSPPVTSYRIHKAIPNSRFVALESSGHIPFFEEPEAFTQVVEDFLSAA